MNNTLLQLLKRAIAYQPVVAKAFGSVKLAILWSQLYYWSDKTTDPDGWIYKTQDELFEETGLSRNEQENARKIGREIGVLEEVRRGVPGKVHFRINIKKSVDIIEKWSEENTEQPIEHVPVVKKTKKKIESNSPEAFNKQFFEQGKKSIEDKRIDDNSIQFKEIIEWALIHHGTVKPEQIKVEIKKFINYWTERTKGGQKELWNTKSTFEVPNRFNTWMGNYYERNKWWKCTKGKWHTKGDKCYCVEDAKVIAEAKNNASQRVYTGVKTIGSLFKK